MTAARLNQAMGHNRLPELASTVYYNCLSKEKSPEEAQNG
jgi:hypothetical protein